MVSISVQHKSIKVGSSTALVLPKNWINEVKAVLESEDILFNIFGEEFLVLEIEGLEIKDEKAQQLFNQLKKHFSLKKKE